MIRITVDKADKCNGETALFVSFPYSSQIVEIMRSFSGRYWHNDTKLWELPSSKLDSLKKKLQGFEYVVNGEEKLVKKVIPIPNDFEFVTKPFKHQREAFEFGLQNEKWFLGDEQGLGKTKQAIDIAVAKKLQHGYKHCLIVCGVNGLKWNWVNEIHTHSKEKAYILGQYPSKGRILIGSNKQKLADVQAIDHIDSYFLITNVETLRDEAIAIELKKLCDNKTIGMVVIDEIHKCKNPSSQQGKAILKLQPEYRLAMTGTPLMNTPLDLYIILRWLGYEKHSFYAFKNHFCIMGGYGNYQICGYKNISELEEQLESVMLRRLKNEVFDLPEKTRINEYVEMTPKQSQIYKEVTTEIRMNIDKIASATNPLSELIRMRQATGYTGILSSTVKESAKLDRMEELVEEAVSNGKQVVIFSNWTQMTDAIWSRLHNKYRLSIITGETKDIDRQDNVEEFQSGASQVIVGTIGAMGTGLTLTAGTVEIFMDEPWNMALKEQAEDRCHRIGTTQNVTIYTLLCKNTIDERINELVEHKGLMADAIVDGKVTINKQELVEYLLS